MLSQESELDDLLKLDITMLQDIEVISASKTLQKISEVAANVHVITAEQIKTHGYFTLEEALSDLPGFQFRNIQGFNSYVFQRGVTNQNNYILLLVDGVQINELNSGGFYGGGQFNLDNVKQIEVVSGPASTLYGTNAISGIINIITLGSEDNQGIEANAAYGSFNTSYGNFGYGHYNNNKKTGFRLSGMFKTSNKADIGGANGDNNWSDNMENFEKDYAVDAQLRFRKLTFGLNFQNKQASRTTNYKTEGTNYLDRNSLWNILFLNSYLKYTHRFTEKLNFESKAYYRNSTVADNTIGYIVDTAQVGYYRPNSLAGIENIFSYKPTGNLSITGGILFEYESLASGFSKSFSNSALEKPPTPEKPDLLSNSLFSVFMQGQYQFFSQLSFTAGARFDNSSVYDQVFTPMTGLIYHSKKFTSKLLYSEAFRAPKPWDYTNGLGNVNLQPEMIKSIEIIANYTINEIVQLNMSVYRNYLYDKINKKTANNSYYWSNHGELTTDGIEIGIDIKYKRLVSYINYTYNNTLDSMDQKIPEIAQHGANAGVIYSFNENIKLSLRGNYLGERKNPKIISATNSDIIEPAFLVHSTISYLNFHNFDFQLIIRNLFDTEYYHTSNRPPDRYRQPQRTIILKCTFSLNK